MDIQALILTLLRLLLGCIFMASSVSKANEPARFAFTLATFKLISTAWVQPVAFLLILAESVIAILLLLGWQSRLAATLCGSLLAIFTFVIGLSLLRGHNDLECGCFGAHHAQKINLKLIGRNILLLMAALCIMLWGGGLLALDSHPLLWKRLLIAEMLMPFILVCAGAFILFLLVRQLYRLLLFIPLEE